MENKNSSDGCNKSEIREIFFIFLFLKEQTKTAAIQKHK